MEFIESQRIEFPNLESKYEELGIFFEKKLWHQLSTALENFLEVPSNNRGTNFRRLYSDFITKFDTRLNPVRLALIISTIGQSFSSPSDSLEFLQNALLSRNKFDAEFSFCLEMDVVLVSLKLGQIEIAKERLEGAKTILSSLTSSETVVFSKFYKSTAEYHKVISLNERGWCALDTDSF